MWSLRLCTCQSQADVLTFLHCGDIFEQRTDFSTHIFCSPLPGIQPQPQLFMAVNHRVRTNREHEHEHEMTLSTTLPRFDPVLSCCLFHFIGLRTLGSCQWIVLRHTTLHTLVYHVPVLMNSKTRSERPRPARCWDVGTYTSTRRRASRCWIRCSCSRRRIGSSALRLLLVLLFSSLLSIFLY